MLSVPYPMSLGTKNRINHTAVTCKTHLREKHRGQAALVEEFILEIEGRDEDATQWQRFTDDRRDTAEMLQRVDAALAQWLNP